MLIGDCILVTREAKKMSQGDIEKRTDLNCCYISRVKNGHTVPSLETLGKLARGTWEFPSIRFSRNLQKHLPHFFLLLSAQTRVNVKEAFKLEVHLISSQRPKIPRMLQRTVTSNHKPLVHST